MPPENKKGLVQVQSAGSVDEEGDVHTIWYSKLNFGIDNVFGLILAFNNNALIRSLLIMLCVCLYVPLIGIYELFFQRFHICYKTQKKKL